MKRVYKYLFVFLGSLFMFPLVSNAACSYERQAELSKIAANVQFSYTYDVVNGNPQFTINITNLTNDIYIENTNDISRQIISGVGEKTISSVNGRTMNFVIYSNDNNCRGEIIVTKYLNVPKFNDLSSDEECKKNPNFKYCQVWTDNESITTEQFEETLEEYKTNNDNNGNLQDQDFWQQIKKFIEQNKIILIISGICIIFLISYWIYRLKKRRN